jgi:hypothetical protein
VSDGSVLESKRNTCLGTEVAKEAVAYTGNAGGRQEPARRGFETRERVVPVILKICEVGNPVLRKVSRHLSAEEIRSNDIQHLIGYMRDTMRDAPGVGLAAPQIENLFRLRSSRIRPSTRRPSRQSS